MPAATIARMNRLDTERHRLFGSDPDAAGDRVRHLVLALGGPADWAPLSAVWRGVQADLDMPAPAIAVNGVDAFELWFPLAEPLPADTAATFLGGLCARYLGDVAPARCRCWPSTDPGLQVDPGRIPQLQAATGRWSAFVAPDLAAVFGDDPSLDLPPGDDAQADLLSRIQPIGRAEFQVAMARLTPEPSSFAPVALPPVPASTIPQHDDPRRFLLAVMNDPSVDMSLRIQAASALLRP
jgi:hypothetical protein